MDPAESIADAYKAEGVKFFFGLGDSNIMMQMKKRDDPDLVPISVRIESSGAFMAMAYARLSGKAGGCTASEPGCTNLVPALLEAYTGCVPMVVPAGGPPLLDLENNSTVFRYKRPLDQLAMMSTVTKWSSRITSVKMTPWYMHRAFSIAYNGRPGPVYIEMPQDTCGISGYMMNPIDVELPEYVPAKRIRIRGDSSLISDAVDLLAKAERPVVVAGGGTVLSRAFDEFREFVELLGIPFQTTTAGRGILPEDHPLAIGLEGMYQTQIGKKYKSDADLLITIGSQGGDYGGDFPEGAKYIQIDTDPFAIGQTKVPDVGIVGDAKLVLRDLIESIRSRIKRNKLEEMPRIRELIKTKKGYEADVESECMIEKGPILAKCVMREISKAFGKNTILAVENASQDLWAYFFPYYKVQDVLGCTGMGGPTIMGQGVAAAIGAKLTVPDKKVVCTTGDGAFQMFMKELPTAVQFNAACTWVVLNNFSLGWPKYYQEKLGYDVTSFKVQPDFVKIAEASKCYGEKVERPSEIRPALENAIKANSEGKPAVLDVIVQTDMSHFQRWK